MSEQDVEALRELLRGAKCACGHDAEWHSGMLGCNAEDYTEPPTACECAEDWVGAVAPILAGRAEAALVSAKAEALREAADEWEALVQREKPPIRGSLWLRRRADRIEREQA